MMGHVSAYAQERLERGANRRTTELLLLCAGAVPVLPVSYTHLTLPTT